VFVSNCSDKDIDGEWLELDTRPLLGLACIRVVRVRGLRDSVENWADAEIEVHGVVTNYEHQWLMIDADDDFLGYQEPGQPLEYFLGYVTNPEKLPIVVPTPEQKRQQERLRADERASEHNVIDPPWLAIGHEKKQKRLRRQAGL
jgi:hypothetical protein